METPIVIPLSGIVLKYMSTNHLAFDHITWYVGNAKQAASHLVTRMGFRQVAYQGLETGQRALACYVVSNGNCYFVLISPVRGPPTESANLSAKDKEALTLIHEHMTRHGDGIKDIAIRVDDVVGVYERAVSTGTKGVTRPTRVRDAEGEAAIAGDEAYGDTTHTFVERSKYRGAFLPGFQAVIGDDPIASLLPKVH